MRQQSTFGRRLQVCVLASILIGLASTTARASTVGVASELGLTPRSLAACGFIGREAGTMLDRILDATRERQHVDEAHAMVRGAMARVEAATQAARQDPENRHAREVLEIALGDLEATQASLLRAHQSLMAVVLDGYDATRLEVLRHFMHSGRHTGSPSFCVVRRSSQAWVEIECAVRAEQRADRTGEALGRGFQSVLSTTRSDPEVQLAHTRLDTNLSVIQAVFDSAH